MSGRNRGRAITDADNNASVLSASKGFDNGDWKELSLGEAQVKLIDCDHRTPPRSDVGYPYVAIPQLRDGRIDLSEVRRISREHYLEWTKKARPQEHDVVLSRRCNPGETAFVPADLEFALGQNLVLLRADGTKIYPPFMRWLARGPEWWEQIRKFLNVGAVFDSLKCADIPNFRFRVPPLEEQHAISHFLGTIDDKIELNRKMNETLEAMARTLFKSWFVGFDPVRAKAEGRDTGLPAHIATLFPDSFEDSELGEIPCGWRCVPFADTVEIIGGGTPKTSVAEYWGGDIPWFSVVDAPSTSDIWAIDTEKKITQAGVENSSTKVLPVRTTIISARGTVGRVALVGVPMAMNQSCYGLRGRIGTRGILTYFATRQVVSLLLQGAHGSVFDTITRDSFERIGIAVAPAPLIEAFENSVELGLQRIRSAVIESRLLATLRDTLLPRLISGELRVEQGYNFVAKEGV